MESTFLAGYEIESELGRGGMGIVYKARQQPFGRVVAIKVFNLTASEDANIRFQREAHALAQLNHPNLVNVYAMNRDERGRPVIICDFIDGKPLSEIIAERKLTLQEVSALFKQLCDGLGALHSAGFVHRDIKPSNLMVRETSHGTELVIIDFGLAKLFIEQTEQKLTATGSLVGTPTYMSPEQFQTGLPLGPGTDLYSAGCVLYEMLAGHPPFQADSPYVVAQCHMMETPEPISQARPDIANAGGWDYFFSKALAKDPSDRFPNAEELLEEFDNTSSGISKGSLPVLNKTRQLAPPKAVAGILIGVLAVSAILASLFLASRHPPGDLDKERKTTLESKVQAAVTHGDGVRERNDQKEAIEYYQRVTDEFEKLGADSSSMARLYIDFSRVLMWNDLSPDDARMDKAVDAMIKATRLRIKQHSRGFDLEDGFWRTLGMYSRRREYAKALSCADMLAEHKHESLKALARRKPPTDLQAAIVSLFQQLYMADEAIEYAKPYAVEFTSADCDNIPMCSRRSLGLAYMQKGRYKDALPFLRDNVEALPFLVNNENSTEQHYKEAFADTLSLAYCYSMLGDTTSSEKRLIVPASAPVINSYEGLEKQLIHAHNLFQLGKIDNGTRELEQVLQGVSQITYLRSDSRVLRDPLYEKYRLYALSVPVAKAMNQPAIAERCAKGMAELRPELERQGMLFPEGTHVPLAKNRVSLPI